MGQYYYTCNITKKEFLFPHKFGDGLKLLEFASAGCGTLAGLAILLAQGNNRGGGDLRSEDPIIGSWAGDKIVVAGDYADLGTFVTKKECEGLVDEDGKPVNYKKINVHTLASLNYKDISIETIFALMDDSYMLEEFEKTEHYDRGDLIKDLVKIKKCDEKDYPTLIGEIKTDDGKRILERGILQKG